MGKPIECHWCEHCIPATGKRIRIQMTTAQPPNSITYKPHIFCSPTCLSEWAEIIRTANPQWLTLEAIPC